MPAKKSILSELEFDLLWMAIRYAMNRQTITSATLPERIIKEYYHRLSGAQKKLICRDLAENERRYSSEAFGNPEIDRPTWLKFWRALDETLHYEVELIDGTKHIVFEANGRIYPLAQYIENPHRETYVDKEAIKTV